MKKTTVAAVLSAGLLAGSGAALTAPGLAFAADSGTSTSTSSTDRATARLTALKDALKGLVTDKTLTQAQADKVASTLAQSDLPFGRGGRHGGGRFLSPEATAKVLGITVDALRTAEQSGKTLAQIAADKGISRSDLISRLVAAAKTQLAADLKAGRLTQAQHDAAVADLTTRITDRVDRVGHGGPRPDAPPPAAPSA